MYKDADTRESRSPQREELIYIGQEESKYWCYKFYYPAKKVIQIGQTVKFLPHHWTVLGTAPTDQLAIAMVDLTNVLHDISHNKVVAPFPIKTTEVQNILHENFRTVVGEPSN